MKLSLYSNTGDLRDRKGEGIVDNASELRSPPHSPTHPSAQLVAAYTIHRTADGSDRLILTMGELTARN